MSEIEPLFDHIAPAARQFHNFHRKWSIESFDIQLKAMAVLAIASVRAKKPNDAFWQAQAAYRYAREIERQEMEYTQRIPA